MSVILLLLALCLTQDENVYTKLQCLNSPSNEICYLRVKDGGNNGYVATKSYSDSTIEGKYVSFRKYCAFDAALPDEEKLANRKLNKATCIYDDDCYSGNCIATTKKCGNLIKDDFHNCDENNDCAVGLICLAHKCAPARKIGEACTIGGDKMCVPEAECYEDKCLGIGSIADGQVSPDDIFCKSQFKLSTTCMPRTYMSKLDVAEGVTYKKCSSHNDCTYNGGMPGDSHTCVFPSKSPNTAGTPEKYCIFGGGEKFMVDAVAKYVSELSKGDENLNAINKKLFDREGRVNYINVISCSHESFELNYKPATTPFPWLMVIIVSLAIIPLLIIPLALLC